MTAAVPWRDAARAALALLATTAAIAVAVRLTASETARSALGFEFPGVSADLGTAAGILVHNARVLAGILLAFCVVQLGRSAELDDDRLTRRFTQVLVGVCDGALLVLCSVHVVLVGSAFGAYGGRVMGPTLAHGPFELAAFALALGLYLAARRERIAVRAAATTVLMSMAALACAACLEVFA